MYKLQLTIISKFKARSHLLYSTQAHMAGKLLLNYNNRHDKNSLLNTSIECHSVIHLNHKYIISSYLIMIFSAYAFLIWIFLFDVCNIYGPHALSTKWGHP